MYVPPAFATESDEALDFIRNCGFGGLVTHEPTGLVATQLPFVVRTEPLRLCGHVARANPHWRSSQSDALMIVQGVNGYVSPSSYPSKAEHGRVVPTWNYEAAHIYGRLTWFEETDRLKDIVERMTLRFEESQRAPWSVADAPAPYVDKMLSAIIGFELEVSRIDASRKLSQNRSQQDRAGVVQALSASPSATDRALAEAMKR